MSCGVCMSLIEEKGLPELDRIGCGASRVVEGGGLFKIREGGGGIP